MDRKLIEPSAVSDREPIYAYSGAATGQQRWPRAQS